MKNLERIDLNELESDDLLKIGGGRWGWGAILVERLLELYNDWEGVKQAFNEGRESYDHEAIIK